MAILLGSIADDYTGASDLANTLTKNGLRTVQTVGIPDPSLALPDVDAVVVSLKIRSVAAAEAVAAATAADGWLRKRGANHVLYKICSTFDSTDAGNIGPVTDALSGGGADSVVLVTPAFPETGRTVYLGHLFVGEQPLNESPLKDHPLNPMHDANLVRVMARQSRGAVGLVDLATVSDGPEAVKARLETLRATGVTAAIADAIFERDLETLGTVALQTWVSTGASGLGLGLARALVRSGQVPLRTGATADAIRPVGGLAAIVAGSCSRATLQQLAIAEQSMPVLRLDPERLLAGSEEINAAISWAGDRISAGPVVIAASATTRNGFSTTITIWARRVWPCNRERNLFHCSGTGRARRAAPGHCGRRDFWRRRRQAWHSGLFDRPRDRTGSAGAANDRQRTRRYAPGVEIGQLRRRGFLRSRAGHDALTDPRKFDADCRRLRRHPSNWKPSLFSLTSLMRPWSR